MKRVWKRSIAVFLVATLAVSLCMTTGWEARAEQEEEESIPSEEIAQEEQGAYVPVSTEKIAQTYAEVNEEGADFQDEEEEQQPLVALSTPTMKSATATNGTIKVTWGAVSNASGYRVYRKTSGGSWTGIGNVTSTSYTDYDVNSGTTYYYTVRAYARDWSEACAHQYETGYWSSHQSAGVSAKASFALSTPSLKSATASSGTIKVTWGSVSGASGYRVYRKTSGGSWSSIGTTTSTSYTDSEVKIGTKYYYTVRAYKGDWSTASANQFKAPYWSDHNSSGVSATGNGALSTPSLKSATASNGTITVKWSSVSGASGYRVYRKTSGGSWKSLGNTTSTSYTDDSDLTVGTKYYYTVRAYKGEWSTASANQFLGAYWSDYNSSGVSASAVSELSTPTLVSTSKVSSGVKVTWKTVSNASGYRVYRKKSGGSWSSLATVQDGSATTYTDTTASSNTLYYYTVRAYKGTWAEASANQFSVHYWSNYDSSGVKYGTVLNEAMYTKAQGYSSSTKWMILVNRKTNKLGVFYGSKNNWEMKYYWDCSTGKSSSKTPKGTCTINGKSKSYNTSSYTTWYLSKFCGDTAIHSVLYKRGSSSSVSDGRLGMNISNGCVRLTKTNSQWIYNNIPLKSTIVVYE